MADNVFKTLKDKFQSTELYKSGYFGLPQDLGGEAEGFDNVIIKKINKLISIKKIGHGESLNVAMAGSILMNYLSQK